MGARQSRRRSLPKSSAASSTSPPLHTRKEPLKQAPPPTQRPQSSHSSESSFWTKSIPPPPSEVGSTLPDDFFGLPPDPDGFADLPPPDANQSMAHEMAREFFERQQNGHVMLQHRSGKSSLTQDKPPAMTQWGRRVAFDNDASAETSTLSCDGHDTAMTSEDDIPEYFKLYGELYDFFVQFGADTPSKVDIDGMVRWTLDEDEGSMDLLNDKLLERFSVDLKGRKKRSGPPSLPARTPPKAPPRKRSFRGAVQQATKSSAGKSSGIGQSMYPVSDIEDSEDEEEDEKVMWSDDDDADMHKNARSRKADNSPESNEPVSGPVADELSEMEERLQAFFKQVESEYPEADASDMMLVFKEDGMLAVNIALYKRYGCNLNTMNFRSKHRSKKRDRRLVKPDSSSSSKSSGSDRKSRLAQQEQSSSVLMGQGGSSTPKGKFNGDYVADSLMKNRTRLNQSQSPPKAPMAQQKQMSREDVRGSGSTSSSEVDPRFDELKVKSSAPMPKPSFLPRRGFTVRRNKSKTNGTPAKSPFSSEPAPAKPAPKKRERKLSALIRTNKTKPRACRQFELDLSAEFGTCKNCGQQRADHMFRKENAETRGAGETLYRQWRRHGVDSGSYS